MKRYARAKTKGPCEQICPRKVKNGSILLTFTSSSSVLWTKSRMCIRFRHKTLSGRERRGESSVGNLARGKENKRKSKNSRTHWKEWKTLGRFLGHQLPCLRKTSIKRIVFGFSLSLWYWQLLQASTQKMPLSRKIRGAKKKAPTTGWGGLMNIKTAKITCTACSPSLPKTTEKPSGITATWQGNTVERLTALATRNCE